MKKMSLLVLALVVSLPGCCKKESAQQPARKNSVEKYMDINGDVEDLDEDDLDMDELTEEDLASFDFDQDVAMPVEDEDEDEDMMEIEENEEFSWIDAQTDDEFKKLYFSFNHYGVRADQKEALSYDIEQVKQLVAEAGSTAQPTVVIEGHACQEGSSLHIIWHCQKSVQKLWQMFL